MQETVQKALSVNLTKLYYYFAKMVVMRNLLLAYILLLTTGCSSLFNVFGGNFKHGPVETIEVGLSSEAQELVKQAYEGIAKPFDHHIHLIGKNNGNYVNPDMQSLWHPMQYIRYRIYISAGGITDLDLADKQYVERLASLIEAIPNHGRYALYAMDKTYTIDGIADLENTPFHIPNENMMEVVETYPNLFVPVISIHPYRKDAVEALDHWASKGVRFVKWLPNSMGIDPSHELTTRFYEKMIEYNMILLSHTGEESAVNSDNQRLGNPLLLRKPLNMGVKVVALHTATDGVGEDLDNLGECVSNFELLLRLLRTPAYVNNLWAEIAATTVYNRMDCLEKLLANTQIHGRLINGSDYPIPAINSVIWLKRLERLGFITRNERHLLKEIYQYNPLLFDFVLKRTLKHPETGVKFPASVFESPFK